MTELEVQPYIKKIAKKDDLSAEDALTVIKHYDAGIKAARAASGLVYSSGVAAAESKFEITTRRGASRVAIGGVALFVGPSIGMIASLFLGNTDPSVVLGILPGVIPALAGAFAADKMNANKDSRLHSIFSPWSYKRAKNEISVEKHLFELKTEEFKQAEAKMLKRTAKALKVINEALSEKGEKMVYNSVIEGGHGFIITKNPAEQLDRWEVMRQRITANTGQHKELQEA